MKAFSLYSYLISYLRRAFRDSPVKTKALGDSRVNRGEYECSVCGYIFQASEVQVDHTDPVVSLTGWDGDWGALIARLFDPKNLTVMCKSCHRKKTNMENEIRRKNKHGPYTSSAYNKEKRIVAMNIKTGRKIRFKSINAAERRLKVNHSSITKVLKGKRNTAKGWRFSYE